MKTICCTVLAGIGNLLLTPENIFFAIFLKFSAWQWNALSSLYRNSPFLSLDKMEHNKFRKSAEDEEVHVTNFENPSIYDEEMLINAPCNDLNEHLRLL